jgi:UDP-N-acetylmuramate: L-alanyl-gamma-D-glutamyl-meso-diaminopimelate ligase
MSTQLAELGIPVLTGYSADNLAWGPDRVVVGNVCRRDHVEVLAAQERGIPLVSFPALLSELFLTDSNSIVVAGTHGKTTTSSLMSFVLSEAGRDPSFLVGGVPINFWRSWRLGHGADFVVEGDEYDTAFFDKKAKTGDPHVGRIRSRRHLCGRGSSEAGVPRIRRAHPARRKPRGLRGF